MLGLRSPLLTQTQRVDNGVPFSPVAPKFSHRHSRAIRRVATHAGGDKGEKPGLGDELLDFMYAGKKLRKWYGEEGMVLPRDGGSPGDEPRNDDEETEPDIPRDQVLVLDADSPTGEQVVLQLILSRANIKALVKDAAAASAGFGPYIQAIQGGATDWRALSRTLRGVRAVVCCGRLGALLPAAAKAGVEHIVLLSAVGASRRGLALFGGGEQGVLGDAEREQQVLRSGIACTVVQVGSILDEPAGSAGIAVRAGGAPAGEITREDAAKVLARAAVSDPVVGTTVVQIQNSGALSAEWEAALDMCLQHQALA